MPPIAISPLRKAWIRWKSLRLPWRKRFLVGLDLQGNSFWEFRDTLSSHKHRMRRIAQYPSTTHYSEINISPQWHQWLRHTRSDPPSLTEQSLDLVRQRNLKVLAAEADARWAAKPSLLDIPKRAETDPVPLLVVNESEVHRSAHLRNGNTTTSSIRSGVDKVPQSTETVLDMALEEEVRVQRREEVTHHSKKRIAEVKGTKMKERGKQEDPWKQTRGSPSEAWQPKAWDGNAASR
jgi:NADH dehydrogenase [ubiquinone] 1 alpha subcomplex assembly factor 2